MLAFALLCCSILFGVFRKVKSVKDRQEVPTGRMNLGEAELIKELIMSVSDGTEDIGSTVYYKLIQNDHTPEETFLKLVGGLPIKRKCIGTDIIYTAEYPFKGILTCTIHAFPEKDRIIASIEFDLKGFPEIRRINFYMVYSLEQEAEEIYCRGILNDVE